MVKIADQNPLEKPSSLLKFLKVMYYAGFLPINWGEFWINGEQQRFEIAMPKTVFMIIIDFLLALTFPSYVCFWHWMKTNDFDIRKLLTVKYYLQMSDGVVTTYLCQVIYFAFPCYAFWIYGTIGHGMKNLNVLLRKPWFCPTFKLMGALNIILISSIMIHAAYFAEIRAKTLIIEQDPKFFWPAILFFGLGILRLVTFKNFYDILLTSLLKGWCANKPAFEFNSRVMLDDWRHVKYQVMQWTQHYQTIMETFSSYLFFIIPMIVASSILTCYLLLSLPISHLSYGNIYMEYFALITFLVSNTIIFFIVIRHCNQAYETINDLQNQILLMRINDDCDEAAENQLQSRQNALVSILSQAKPLTGRGYFDVDRPMIISILGAAITYIIVLLQFNMSEKQTMDQARALAFNESIEMV